MSLVLQRQTLKLAIKITTIAEKVQMDLTIPFSQHCCPPNPNPYPFTMSGLQSQICFLIWLCCLVQSGLGQCEVAELWSYQQVQDPGSEGFKTREAQPQVLQQADEHFHPEGYTHEIIQQMFRWASSVPISSVNRNQWATRSSRRLSHID